MTLVFEKHGYQVPIEKLKVHHKLLSEVVEFPDRTSKEFYHYFNAELVMSLGIVPKEELLTEIFSACSYLPWERFNDTNWISSSKIPVGVLSNFNNNLPGILNELFGNIFTNIVVSESLEIRKPDVAFFRYALEVIGLPADQIMYVGDSLKLDMIPATKVGFKTYLIDRLNTYGEYKNRLSFLHELNSVI